MTTRSSHNHLLTLAGQLVDRLASRIEYGTPIWPAPPSPPSPPGSLILGHMAEGWRHPLELFARCVAEYGPITRLRFGTSSYYLINDPDLVHHVFVENPRNYKKSRNYRGLRNVIGDGLFTSEGDTWRRQRKLAQPAFHRERIFAFAETMSRSTRELLARLSAQPEQPLAWDEEMGELALRIVSRTLFSSEIDADVAAIRESVGFVNEYGGNAYFLPTWMPTPTNRALKRTMAVFDALIYPLIAERQSHANDRGDLLSMLIAAQDEATGERMSARQVRDEALTLIIGGHETTGNVLSWTFYLLSRHPEIERRLREHVVSVLGERDPAAEDVARLGYVTQVIQEAMRLYPPAWVIERETLVADVLSGYKIPAGATVAVSPFVLHRNPIFWDNPEGFDPDRFAPELVRRRSRYVYLPFGSGPRLCIGNTFSMMETVIIVSMIVRDFHLQLVPGHKVEPEPLVTLRPKYGLRMTARPCLHSVQKEESHA